MGKPRNLEARAAHAARDKAKALLVDEEPRALRQADELPPPHETDEERADRERRRNGRGSRKFFRHRKYRPQFASITRLRMRTEHNAENPPDDVPRYKSAAKHEDGTLVRLYDEDRYGRTGNFIGFGCTETGRLFTPSGNLSEQFREVHKQGLLIRHTRSGAHASRRIAADRAGIPTPESEIKEAERAAL